MTQKIRQYFTENSKLLQVFLFCIAFVFLFFIFFTYQFLPFSYWIFFVLLGLFSLVFVALMFRFFIRQQKTYTRELVAVRGELQNQLQNFEKQQAQCLSLDAQYFVIDSTVLFASYLPDRTLVSISTAFKNFLALDNSPRLIQDIFSVTEEQRPKILEVFKVKNHYLTTDEISFKKGGDLIFLSLKLMPFHHYKHGKITFVYVTDITTYKKSENEMARLKQKEYDAQVAFQKNLATQVVASQEKERARIAKDIHDGIGQVLTALKFTLESIDFSKFEGKFREKMTHFKNVFSGLIKDVRAVTFQLTPPELADYGIIAGIERMTKEIAKLSDKKIIFECNTDRNQKISFTSLVEINLYRVTQEAVNNALKYADASYILVRIIVTDEMFSIVIEDDGNGFEIPLKKQSKKKSGGMGLFFMEERVRYIDGQFFIDSKKGEGTRILININQKNISFTL